MSRLVPAGLRERIVSYIAAEAKDWDHLAQADKTTLVGRWVQSAAVGGVLRPLLGGDAEVRVWITDVALKRRARSLLASPEDVAQAVLGDGAQVRSGSAGLKPAHCVATNDKGVFYLCWDRAVNMRHLFWAAVCSRVDMTDLDGSIVAIIDPLASSTEPSARARLEKVAEACGIGVRWVEA